MQIDYAVLAKLIDKAVQDADSFNKVWIGLDTVSISLIAILLGSATQILVARRQQRSQEAVAAEQAVVHKMSAEQQWKTQELASRRAAVANIASMRQTWINDLRYDVATYLTAWREITYRWQAHIDDHRDVDRIPEDILDIFTQVTAKLRMEALELAIRIQLRLNPSEAEHAALRNNMDSLEESAYKFSHSLSKSQAEDLSDEVHFKIVHITTCTQKILKNEWDRIKDESYVRPVDSL